MLVQICNRTLKEGSKFKARLVYLVRPCLRSEEVYMALRGAGWSLKPWQIFPRKGVLALLPG